MFAENLRMRVDGATPALDVSLDLNAGLRTRNKDVNTYLDAKALADERLADLKSVQVDDTHCIERIVRALAHLKRKTNRAPKWRLHVSLAGDYWFSVRDEYQKVHDYESLTLHVLSALKPPPSL
jgi:hypothetical protein